MGRGASGLNRGSGIKTATSQDANLIAGIPGEYTLYRAGDLNVQQGIIFMTTSRATAETYQDTGSTHRDVNTYSLNISNPLVIDGEGMDTVALRKGWLALHPGKTMADYRKKLGSGGLTAKKWQQLDRENATGLNASPYDAVVYKNGNKIKEVWVSKKRKRDFK